MTKISNKTRKTVDRASNKMSTWKCLSYDVVQLLQLGCRFGSKSPISQRKREKINGQKVHFGKGKDPPV